MAGVVIAGVAIGGRVAMNAYKHFKAGNLSLPKGSTLSSLNSNFNLICFIFHLCRLPFFSLCLSCGGLGLHFCSGAQGSIEDEVLLHGRL